ncbi:MAG: hypothetical protein RLY93_14195 [Sumerlaeia bacterium]
MTPPASKSSESARAEGRKPAFARPSFFSQSHDGRPVVSAGQSGLTKRELLALEMHKSMLANPNITRSVSTGEDIITHFSEEEFARNLAQLAIMHADVLLEELENTSKGDNPMRPHREAERAGEG